MSRAVSVVDGVTGTTVDSCTGTTAWPSIVSGGPVLRLPAGWSSRSVRSVKQDKLAVPEAMQYPKQRSTHQRLPCHRGRSLLPDVEVRVSSVVVGYRVGSAGATLGTM